MLWHDLDSLELNEQLILGALVEELEEDSALDGLARPVKGVLLVKSDEHVACSLVMGCLVHFQEFLEMFLLEVRGYSKHVHHRGRIVCGTRVVF